MTRDRLFFVLGSLLAGSAVAAGAFGAHSLEGRVEPRMLEVFETAARHQFLHALGLLAVAWATTRWPSAGIELGGWLIAAGTAVFAGSLYLMVGSGARWLGAVTPVGGVLMIAGWAVLAWRVVRAR